MLELRGISKVYKTGGVKQKALDGVSLNFRENEFVAILGPSGSGKTTLLNIIGGLDHYSEGDLKINEVSTKDFSDRDWDAYRNHRVGFVFQSYNLIGHQSVLRNVEIALTLSGVSKRARVRRAKEALAEVGLSKHIYKRPGQLSGGQMQRVAIARALVNNPDIVLADEPTGALDTATSEQIMKLLKKVAEKKLVIMVTHNPELAREYATRVVRVTDGKVVSDSRPYDGKRDTREALEVERRKSRKTSMSLFTALSLSFNNLRTKMGRTILTAFAGSIGIIGIALILALSNGIQAYIDRTEEEALANYPVTIRRQSMDMSALMGALMGANGEREHEDGKVYSNNVMGGLFEAMSEEVGVENDLASLKEYVEGSEEIRDLSLGVIYGYDVPISIYAEDGTRVNPATTMAAVGMGSMASGYGGMVNMDVFVELADDVDGPLRTVLDRQYELVSGRWPKEWNEVVLAVNENMEITDYSLYSLGLLSQKELSQKFIGMFSGEKAEFPVVSYELEELLGLKYRLAVPGADYSADQMAEIYGGGVVPLGDAAAVEELSVVGVLKYNSEVGMAAGGVGYLPALTEHVALAMGRDLADPDAIAIYPRDFDAKSEIVAILDDYNAGLPEEKKISYSDTVGVLMSSVSTIVNVVSSVLIAFVAISLIVSSIMIAIITYVSVLERTKEIGILRAVGASKRDISRVFNAETLIEGLAAGVLGIAVTLLLLIPANMVIEAVTEISGLAVLPVTGALGLIVISVLLTVVAGLIPAKIASKKDPVEALRSE